jgi:hypothetical protein
MAGMANSLNYGFLAAGTTKNQALPQESSRFRRAPIKHAIRSATAAGL